MATDERMVLERIQQLLMGVRGQIAKLPNCRERSLAATKLDECELWLGRVLAPQKDFVDA